MMSSMCSMPMLRRTVPALMPALARPASSSWEWVVVAGWTHSERTSPMLARLENRLRASMKAAPASRPPARSNAKTDPAPRGQYVR